MQSLKHFLTHNWFAKLFSVVLATVLWLAIASETSSEIGIEVPLQYRNVPPHLEVTEETTNVVEVRLRGSANLIKELSPQEISTTVDLGGMEPGEKVFPLTIQNIQAPFGIDVVRVNPSRVRLNLERTLSKLLPVAPNVMGKPAAGFEVKEISVVPNMVEVQGPESKVRDLETASAGPVDIEGANSDIHASVDLDISEPLVRLQYYSAADVRVKIGEETSERKITVSRDPTLDATRITIRPAAVDVTLKGPRSKVSGVNPEQLHFTVEVASLAAGEHKLQPKIVGLDENLELSSVSPDRVSVRIRQ